MPGIARVSDKTTGTCSVGNICCPHTRNGTVTKGSANVFANDLPACSVDDTGSCNCPHGGNFKIIEGSATVFINGKRASRNGDGTRCQNCGRGGNLISGSGNVFVGG